MKKFIRRLCCKKEVKEHEKTVVKLKSERQKSIDDVRKINEKLKIAVNRGDIEIVIKNIDGVINKL